MSGQHCSRASRIGMSRQTKPSPDLAVALALPVSRSLRSPLSSAGSPRLGGWRAPEVIKRPCPRRPEAVGQVPGEVAALIDLRRPKGKSPSWPPAPLGQLNPLRSSSACTGSPLRCARRSRRSSHCFSWREAGPKRSPPAQGRKRRGKRALAAQLTGRGGSWRRSPSRSMGSHRAHPRRDHGRARVEGARPRQDLGAAAPLRAKRAGRRGF